MKAKPKNSRIEKCLLYPTTLKKIYAKMQISGLQKLTLIDYPKKLACTIFLFGCNLRCGFCHNPNLVIAEKENKPILKEEVLEFLRKRKPYLDGVCITGGEPTINEALPSFVEQIKKLGYSVKIDTNGTNPEMISDLIARKLADYIAMDIKTDKENYYSLTKTEVNVNNIEQSIRLITNSGIDYEFRTTCIPKHHTSETIENIGKWLVELTGKKPKNYFLQGFINREEGLVDDNFSTIENMQEKDLESMKKIAEKYFEKVEIRA
jgi:pyruvate formate lyase activating enzyme